METNEVISTEELLKVMQVLQTTLDINFLIENFSKELQSITSHNYLNYKNIDQNINIKIGDQTANKVVIELDLDKRKLGKLVISRKTEFSDNEKEKINRLAILLLFPINNILNYRQAIANANIDPITKLNNRMLFNKILEQEIDFAQRYNQKLLMMMIDLDNFKKINDEYGHIVGDIMLKNVSGFLKKFMRRSDLVFRYGGDEFCIILRNTTLNGANELANRIRKSINNEIFTCGDHEIKITVSIGLVKIHEEDDSIKFIERADRLLYEAKEIGRNNVITEAPS
ncbi:MAG: GGDEF domain-containing protein [Gammaproteobacteria bacterium]